MIDINLQIQTEALNHYQELHRHPELSFQEHRTSAYIRKILEQQHIAHVKAGATGIIGFLPGLDSSRTIALRADTDALPIRENPAHSLLSQTDGVMHACGHDLHTACLLGAASCLNRLPSRPANILLIFQHAEEVLPGGAQEIIDHPFFRQHLPEWIIALHAEPELPVGSVGLRSGQYMASGDEIYIHLHGPGGHAAMPEKTADLVLIASHIIVALQQITSRQASPLMPTVLTFGNIRCSSAMNIIPQDITLEGTFRTFSEAWRTKAKQHIRQIARSIAESMGAECQVEIIPGYPCLYNDPEKTGHARQLLQSFLGQEKVIDLPLRMTTEDFARYSQQLPATFIRLGVEGRQACGKLHTPDFCPDPAALNYGIGTLCLLATTR